jgi:predicted dehydrogenase
MRSGNATVTCAVLLASLFISAAAGGEADAPIRIGMIGLDTSHVSVFSSLINGADPPAELAGLRVVAAFPAGNPEFPLSRDRVQGFTKELEGRGVQMVDSIEALLPLVDVVMLESVDGTQHLEQARPVLAAGKPLFIDKPLAASLVDAVAIDMLAEQFGTPWFTASSSRFTPGYRELRDGNGVGQVLGCDAYSQSRAAAGHPDLFWYGVHGVDLLYTIMGVGCREVTALQTELTESVRGEWDGGRIGTYRSIREHTGKTGLGVTVFGSEGIVHHNRYYEYLPLLVAVAEFFRTQQSPASEDEMLEVFVFLAAAEVSKRSGGATVELAPLLESARAEAKKRIAELPPTAP